MIRGQIRPAAQPAEVWFYELWKLLVRIALVGLAVYVIWRIRSILTDILVSSILAFVLVGPVNSLCHYHIPRVRSRTQRLIASLIVFLLFFFAVGVSVTVLTSPFRTEAQHLVTNFPQYQKQAQHLLLSAKTWYATLSPEMRGFIEKQSSDGMSMASPSAFLGTALESTVSGLGKIVDIILIPVLAFYFVLDGRGLRNEFLVLLPRQRQREAIKLLHDASGIMRTFVIAQLWLCIIAGLVVFIGLYAIGMPYPVILGLLAGITRAIPIIGPVIGGFPIVLLALITGGPMLAIKVLIFFSMMHLVESKLIMPKFIGHRIHLHAAVVIIVLLIGYEFFGLLGMFFAAPVAAFARVLVQHYVLRPRRRRALLGPATEIDQPLIIKSR